VKDEAAARRRLLGRLLRMARVKKRFTQTQAANYLGCRQGKINKIETTLVTIKPDELDKLIELYEVSDEQAAELRELATVDQQAGPSRTRYSPSWSAFEQLSDVEQDATEILCLHSERIPGPLQSEQYILRLHQPAAAEVVLVLSQRKARAQIFTVDRPPRYRVILSESSLRRMPGGRAAGLLVDQATHLLNLIDQYEHLELQILTFDADVRFVDSDFVLLRFDEPKQDFIYVECPGGSHRFKAAEELNKVQVHWETLHAAALSREDTVAFLRKLVEMDSDRSGGPGGYAK
jgi:transcriptional regulator with XRE-family HTH domain